VQSDNTVEVFCSYASADDIWRQKLEAHVRLSTRQGLFTFWHRQLIVPGEDQQQVIDAHLKSADVILLFVSSDFLDSEDCYSREMPQALERHRRGEARVIPILIRAVDWEKAPFAHLSPLPTNKKPLMRWEDKDAALTHVAMYLRHVIEGALTHTDVSLQEICPYKGLSPYREEDAAFFFGREAYLQDLLKLLQAQRRFLLLLGPLGSGKTSLVQAGLIPRLRRHSLPGVTCTDIAIYTPHRPLLETWLALPVFDAASTSVEGLHRWREHHPFPAWPVLIVDAFEELFHCADAAERRSFIEQLVEIIKGDLATIILVMRDDYYGDLAAYQSLIHYLERQTSNIPHLTVEMAREIIQKPTGLAGLKIETSLVNTIADATMSTQAEPRRRRLHRQSSVLPLLSSTLTRLFEKREEGELKVQAYDDLGGIAGSLATWATEAYSVLSPVQKKLARRIFTNLVVPGDESSGVLDHKQEQTLAALARDAQEYPLVQEVVEHFAKAHLLEISYDPVHQDRRVDMIHEALLHEWPLLQDWLREDHQYLSWYRPFQKQAERWHSFQMHDNERLAVETLLRESELVVAQEWYHQRGAGWSQNERLFLDASRNALEQEKARHKAHQQAEQDRRHLFAQALAMQALLLQEQHPEHIELSILLAAEAMKRYPSFEAKKAFKKGLQLLPQTLLHIQRTMNYTRLAASTDGSHIAAAGESGLVWIQQAYDETCVQFFPEWTQIHALALNSDGTTALLLSGPPRSQDAWIVDLFRKQPPQRLHHNEVVVQVMYRGDEAMTVTEGGTILCWRPDDATLQRRFAHADLTTMSLSPDERYLATASRDGTVKLWDLVQGVCRETFGHRQGIQIVAFHPERALLVVATDDAIIVWDWETEKRHSFLQPPRRAKAHFRAASPILALGFADNILVAGERHSVHLWDIDAEQALCSYKLRTPLQTLLVHPGRHLLATAEENGTVFLWDLNRTKATPVAILPRPGVVQSLCFHPYKPYLATASQKGGVRFWQYGVSRELTTVDYPGTVEEMGFSQQEETLKLQVTVKETEQARKQIWTIAPGAVVPEMRAQPEQEHLIITGGIDQSLFPTSALREVLSSNRVYKIVRSSASSLTLSQLQGNRYVPCASYQHPCALTALAISTDGQYVAIADETSAFALWDWRQHSLEILPWKYPYEVRHLTFPDEYSLLAISEKQMIGVWDRREGKVRYMFNHNCPIHGVESHPAGCLFLTVSDDTFVRLWSCEHAERLYALPHFSPVQKAIFSPTGRFIITTSTDHIVHLWDVATGRPLAELEHDGEIYKLAVSADENYLASASRDQYIRIWRWTTDTLFEEARYHMTRNLTPEEWLQYLGDIPYEETFVLDWRADERFFD
jgi:WD40 repeat protein